MAWANQLELFHTSVNKGRPPIVIKTSKWYAYDSNVRMDYIICFLMILPFLVSRQELDGRKQSWDVIMNLYDGVRTIIFKDSRYSAYSEVVWELRYFLASMKELQPQSGVGAVGVTATYRAVLKSMANVYNNDDIDRNLVDNIVPILIKIYLFIESDGRYGGDRKDNVILLEKGE